MTWWPWLVVVGVILVLAIVILVMIIVTSNKLAILKSAVDRNFPVINSKIKQYCEIVGLVLDFSETKLKKRTKASENLLKLKKDCLDTEVMVTRALKQREVAEKTKSYISSLKRREEFKKSRKLDKWIKELDELELALIKSIEKYNDAVDKYNKVRKTFPANLISTRFKFAERKQWGL